MLRPTTLLSCSCFRALTCTQGGSRARVEKEFSGSYDSYLLFLLRSDDAQSVDDGLRGVLHVTVIELRVVLDLL